MSKLYWIYFNRLKDAPLVWSIDEGDQASEINVSAIVLHNCTVESKVNLAETDTENCPKAWFEIRGSLGVSQGVAVITGTRVSERLEG